jgi:hypothetical protein
MAKSDRSSESIEKLLQERSQYEQWLARLDASGAPESVRSRVRSDYESRLDNVMAQLRAHESTIAEALGRHHLDRERLEARESELLETLAEAEVRHAVGEYDDKQWNEISGTQKKSLSELRGDLEKVRSEVSRLSEVQRLILAAPEPAPVEPEPAPIVPAPADPVAFAPPTPPVPAPAPAEPAAPRFVPRPPAPTPAQRLAGDELDFLKSVAVEQSASLSPAAAEKQRGAAGQGGVTTTTPPPEPSPQAAAPQQPAPSGAPAQRPAAAAPAGAVKTLKCGDCGTLNRPTEWYCERCGAELAAL